MMINKSIITKGKREFLLALLLCVGWISPAHSQQVKFNDKGDWSAGDYTLEFVYFDPSWTPTRLSQGFRVNQQEAGNGLAKRSGVFIPRSMVASPFDLSMEALARPDGKTALTLRADSKEGPVQANAIGLNLELPLGRGVVLTLDGKTHTLGEEEGAGRWFSTPGSFSTLEIVDSRGLLRLEGDLRVIMQDGRRHGREGAQLRILANPSSGAFDHTELDVLVTYADHEYEILDLSMVANRTLIDEVAGDGEGGWTDQGPERDMRLLPTGLAEWNHIPYKIIESGNQVLALRGQGGDHNPPVLEVELDGGKVGTLFLFHASAWTPKHETAIGRLVLVDTEGREHTQEVLATRDVGDWIAPFPMVNGEVPWQAMMERHPVCMFLSRYDFPDVEGKVLRFESTGIGQWLVLAATTSPDKVPLPRAPRAQALVMAEDDTWRRLDHKMDVIEGSALDFSWVIDAPAGKYGHVIIDGGKMYFEDSPDEPVRFFGTNLVHSATFPTKENAEIIAKRLSMMGYNAVRLHHVDRHIYPRDSLTADPELLDRFFYLCSVLKERGLYISVDIYCSRRFSKELFPLLGKNITDKNWFKMLFAVSEEAMDVWKKQADELLLTPNPYTGIPLGHDPALMSICLVNEDAITELWDSSPEVAQLYRAKFEEWLAAEGYDVTDVGERQQLMVKFLTASQTRQYEEMRGYLLSQGIRTPTSGLNWGDHLATMWTRSTLDYVDNHSYWNHPRYPKGIGNRPHLYTDQSVLSADGKTPRDLFPTRVFGLPFFVTEFNYCYPNVWRGEGGAVMGAYAAFQGWNGIFRFGMNRIDHISAPVTFDTGQDPVSLLADRIISLLYLRGDVAPANYSIGYRLPDAKPVAGIPGRFPLPFSRLGLVTGLGTLDPWSSSEVDVLAERLPENDKEAVALYKKFKTSTGGGQSRFEPGNGVYVSDTGEIVLSREDLTFRVVTGRSEVLVLPPLGELQGGLMSARNLSERPATVAVLSLDGALLPQSRHILVLHLTSVEGTAASYTDDTRTVLESYGRLPHLVSGGVVELSLQGLGGGDGKTLFALSADGSRLREVKLDNDGSTLGASLDVHATGEPVLAYELVVPKDG